MPFSDHAFDLRKRSRCFSTSAGTATITISRSTERSMGTIDGCAGTAERRSRTEPVWYCPPQSSVLPRFAGSFPCSRTERLCDRQHTRHMSPCRLPCFGSGRCRECRKEKKKRGLPRKLLQIAVGTDSQGGALLRLGSRGLAGTGDSMDAFLGHIAPGSTVYHDMRHFAICFLGCTEVAVNSKDGEAYELLNPVNRLCAQVKRLFAVHLRIHRKNVPLWLSEKAFQMEQGKGLSFCTYRSLLYREIFLSGKTLRRWEVYGN